MVSEQSLVQMLQALVVSTKDLRKQVSEQKKEQAKERTETKAFQENLLEELKELKHDHQQLKEEQAALKRLIQNTREMMETTVETVKNLDTKVDFITEIVAQLSKTLLEEDNDVTERFEQHLTNVETVIGNTIQKQMTDNYVMPIQNLANKTSDLSKSVQQVHADQTAITKQMGHLQETIDENSNIIATTSARVDSLANIKAVQETSQFTINNADNIDDQLELIDKQLATFEN